ncbi:MAG: hypothetical protein L0219_21945 [Phycisphaerales bacterium]|nr:hypothetical protein [Phycisphaerales bacterium]
MKLRTLLTLQFLYAAMALGYLAVSYLRMQSGDVPLSKAPPVTAMLMFVIYAACVFFFGVKYEEKPYRIAMAIAIPGCAFGGVLMNIVSYFQNGLEGFSSFAAWAIGVAINTYGLIWNVIAAIGAYKR